MDRLLRLQAGANPAGLAAGPKLVVHVASLPAFADNRLADVVDLVARGTHVPLPPTGYARDNRPAVNLDGFLNVMYAFPAGYAQFFRSGVIEGVLELPQDSAGVFINGFDFANTVVFAVKQYLDVLASYGAGEPFAAFVGITEARGVYLHHGMRSPSGGFYRSEPSTEDLIATPDVQLQASDAGVANRLRPAFNMVWNAFGVHPCDLYNQANEWIGAA